MSLTLTSPSFRTSQMIPAEHTCDGENRSPELAWSGVPPGTASLALICHDPDAPAGIWTHWVVANLPAGLAGLPAGVPPAERLPRGGVHGRNDWGRLGYGGPCPPGGTHRYIFTLYAVDQVTDLAPGATREEVLAALRGHVLAEAELMGRYRRR